MDLQTLLASLLGSIQQPGSPFSGFNAASYGGGALSGAAQNPFFSYSGLGTPSYQPNGSINFSQASGSPWAPIDPTQAILAFQPLFNAITQNLGSNSSTYSPPAFNSQPSSQSSTSPAPSPAPIQAQAPPKAGPPSGAVDLGFQYGGQEVFGVPSGNATGNPNGMTYTLPEFGGIQIGDNPAQGYDANYYGTTPQQNRATPWEQGGAAALTAAGVPTNWSWSMLSGAPAQPPPAPVPQPTPPNPSNQRSSLPGQVNTNIGGTPQSNPFLNSGFGSSSQAQWIANRRAQVASNAY